MIRVGIIGFGKMGRVRQAAVAECPGFRLVALADPVEPRPLPADCQFFPDPQALVRTDVDAVFVCTPNHVTADLVVAALDAGKHVFCEKPPGRDLGDVRRILEAEARNPGLTLKFGFNHRYHDAVLEALALVESGRLGRLLWMRGVYGKSGGVGFEEGWRSRREMAGGGILLDQGIHMLDLFRLFCGDFDEVKSFVGNAFWNIDVEDNAFALLRNKRGQVAMLHSSSTQWKHVFSLEMFLSEGYLAINGLLSGTRSYGRETLITARRQFGGEGYTLGRPREEVTTFDEDRSWSRETEEFAACVRDGRPVRHGTSQDALRAMELVKRIYEGDETWRPGSRRP
jgi:predicted dehydrogenase